jgi:hypothetical protein
MCDSFLVIVRAGDSLVLHIMADTLVSKWRSALEGADLKEATLGARLRIPVSQEQRRMASETGTTLVVTC